MSIAGTRSSRGDEYQILISMSWAVNILKAPHLYKRIEIDSTSIDTDGEPIKVDDIVITKSDNSKIYCQCKKNEPDFKSWSISTLKAELIKASITISNNKDSLIYFYSRTAFGEVAKLREHAAQYEDQAAFESSLSDELRGINSKLLKCIESSGISTYVFLKQTHFEHTGEYKTLELSLRERLEYLITSPNIAYNILHTKCTELWARVATPDFYTTQPYQYYTPEDLLKFMHDAGSYLAPPKTESEIQNTFNSISTVGSQWRRDIAGKCIESKTVENLLRIITETTEEKTANKGSNKILLLGAPGSGKTCILLELKDCLRQQADKAVLFIQSKSFVHINALVVKSGGLPTDLVEQVARMAEYKHTVILIDSLDTLSLAREHATFDLFLTYIDRLSVLRNVTLVVACREFDSQFDQKIASHSWTTKIFCDALSWEQDICPFLEEMGINTTQLDDLTRSLLRNPFHLALFVDVVKSKPVFNALNTQHLAQKYLEEVVQKDPTLGDEAIRHLQEIAQKMLVQRSSYIRKHAVSLPHTILTKLLSHQILNESNGKIELGHQLLIDVLVIMKNEREGKTLKNLIDDLAPVPFVRPTIRAYVLYLSSNDRMHFRRQIRAILFNNEIAFHIRRLVAETFAEVTPSNEDWSLIRDLRGQQRILFDALYKSTKSVDWYSFWRIYLEKEIISTKDILAYQDHIFHISKWKNSNPKEVLEFWSDALDCSWINHNYVTQTIERELVDFEANGTISSAPLLKKLLSLGIKSDSEYYFLGKAISKCVEQENDHDDLFWQFITYEVKEDETYNSYGYEWEEKLLDKDYYFAHENFLAQRLIGSPSLLVLAVNSINEWSNIYHSHYNHFDTHGLLHTSYADNHLKEGDVYASDRVLFKALEHAIIHHIQLGSSWWQKQSSQITFSSNAALCYSGIIGLTKYPENNLSVIFSILTNKELLESDASTTYPLGDELCNLIRKTFHLLGEEQQDQILYTVTNLYSDEVDASPAYLQSLRYFQIKYISSVPTYLRTEHFQSLLDEYRKQHLTNCDIDIPFITDRGGIVRSPISSSGLLQLSDKGLIEILNYYKNNPSYPWGTDGYIGGKEDVGRELNNSAAVSPERFLKLLGSSWYQLDDKFKDSIISGIGDYIFYHYGNLQKPANYVALETPSKDALLSLTLNLLECYSSYWHHHSSVAGVLNACSHIVEDSTDVDRILFLTMGYLTDDTPSTVQSSSSDLLGLGINSNKGRIADTLMLLVIHEREKNRNLSASLIANLKYYATSENYAVRAMIALRLARLQSIDFDLGWELFDMVIDNSNAQLWHISERCLYYAYHRYPEIVQAKLNMLYQVAEDEKAMEIWSRISALMVLSATITLEQFIIKAKRHSWTTSIWKGALKVWAHPTNIEHFPEVCFNAIQNLLENPDIASSLAPEIMERLIRNDRMGNDIILPPRNIVSLLFLNMQNIASLYSLGNWLVVVAQRDINAALYAIECLTQLLGKNKNPAEYGMGNDFSKLLTMLYRYAEEREEEDSGATLDRVLVIQNALLEANVGGLNEWLKEAERP